jgi:hypothetical protein
VTPALEHGTAAGYERHRRARETPCELCRAAKRGYQLGMRRRNEREAGMPDELTTALLAACRAIVLRRPAPRIQELAAHALQVAGRQGPRNGLAECGTHGGYQAHRAKGEPVCEPCRMANVQASRDRRAAEARQQHDGGKAAA